MHTPIPLYALRPLEAGTRDVKGLSSTWRSMQREASFFQRRYDLRGPQSSSSLPLAELATFLDRLDQIIAQVSDARRSNDPQNAVQLTVRDDPMAPDYLLAIFHWRDHAGDLDDPQSSGSLSTLLYGCERWLELNVAAMDTDDGRRLMMIKRELEDLLERHGKLPAYIEPPSLTEP